MTSIFAQRNEPAGPAASLRPIGILGDVDLIVYTAAARLLGRKAGAVLRQGLDDPAEVRELRALEVRRAATWRHGEERPTPSPDLSVGVDEIFAFEVVERSVQMSLGGRPRFQHALSVGLSPYDVEGDIRIRPGGDPLATFARSTGLVVLRDAWIEYPVGPARRRRLARRLVVNRDHAQSFGLAATTELDLQPDTGRYAALFREVRRGAGG